MGRYHEGAQGQGIGHGGRRAGTAVPAHIRARRARRDHDPADQGAARAGGAHSGHPTVDDTVESIERMNISDSEKEKIFASNAKSILRLTTK